MRPRVQHPSVTEQKYREGWMWVFRYWADEPQPDGTTKPVRKQQIAGPSRGPGAIGKRQAELERDRFLAQISQQAPAPVATEAAAPTTAPVCALLGDVARMYEEGYLSRHHQISRPTREKERFYLNTYIVPRWGELHLDEVQPKAVEDWLHTTFDSWWTMHGVRAIMIRLYRYAEGHGLWEEGKRSPASKAKLGPKRYAYERRILSFDEAARVLANLDEPYKLIIETCIATGARISEVLGLTWEHVNLQEATIRIDQRVWHQDVGKPKTEHSRRLLGIGDLVARYRARAAAEMHRATDFVFQQKRAPGRPLWDSGVRDALHQAAQAAGCDFPGLGPHSFRRANITWRQEVGGTSLEASKIAGHADLDMTGEYTFVAPDRQNELTRRIQAKLRDADTGGKPPKRAVVIPIRSKAG